MWAELFLENRENLLHELDLFLASLKEYRDALQEKDFPKIQSLLLDGKRLKEEVDRR
jgi:prephenate dehydrogenase